MQRKELKTGKSRFDGNWSIIIVIFSGIQNINRGADLHKNDTEKLCFEEQHAWTPMAPSYINRAIRNLGT